MNPVQDSLLNTATAAIMRDALLEPGERVIAAVSGGADSTALLHLLAALGYRVEAAHFDHHTREGESARDAGFVRDMAAGLGVPFHAGGTDVAADARTAGRSFEDQARAARYAFLRRLAEETGCSAVATGHHRDDQAETVLLRLLRGTAGRGLAGMLPVRMEGGLRIVRPLLGCTRAELRAWLESRAIPWREDATNADPDHARRNRVRHELLPALARDHNPLIHAALARLADAQRLDNALLEELLERESARLGIGPVAPEQIPVPALLSMHPALRRRWWAIQLANQGGRVDGARIDAAETFLAAARTGARLDLGHGLFLCRGRGAVLFSREPAAACETVALAVPGETAALGRLFRVTLKPAVALPPGGARAWCGPSRQVFDAARIKGALRVRTRRPGDRFRPLGMDHARKLQDYLVDRGVPEPLRDAVPLVTADEVIVWIVGHAPSSDAAVTPETEQLIEVEVRHAGE
jgi:tRNA(Ile)-lysidine synthase